MATVKRDRRAFITLIEAAMRLGVSYIAAHRFVLTRLLQGAKRGSRWFVTQESVDRLLHQRAVRNADQTD